MECPKVGSSGSGGGGGRMVMGSSLPHNEVEEAIPSRIQQERMSSSAAVPPPDLQQLAAGSITGVADAQERKREPDASCDVCMEKTEGHQMHQHFPANPNPSAFSSEVVVVNPPNHMHTPGLSARECKEPQNEAKEEQRSKSETKTSQDTTTTTRTIEEPYSAVAIGSITTLTPPTNLLPAAVLLEERHGSSAVSDKNHARPMDEEDQQCKKNAAQPEPLTNGSSGAHGKVEDNEADEAAIDDASPTNTQRRQVTPDDHDEETEGVAILSEAAAVANVAAATSKDPPAPPTLERNVMNTTVSSVSSQQQQQQQQTASSSPVLNEGIVSIGQVTANGGTQMNTVPSEQQQQQQQQSVVMTTTEEATVSQQQQQRQRDDSNRQSQQGDRAAANTAVANLSSGSAEEFPGGAVLGEPPQQQPQPTAPVASAVNGHRPTGTTTPNRRSRQSSAASSTTTPRRSRLQHEIAESSSRRKVERGVNGAHCKTHSPTLDELQNTTFSDFVRQNVLQKAAMYEFNKDKQLTPKQMQEFYMKEPMELMEGIAKVRLPDGFFPSAPYGKDRTGRGPLWQAGTDLGDRQISSPIQQNIRGMAGVYEYTHTDLKPCTFAEFRERADKYRKEQMGSAMLDFSKKKKDDNEDKNTNDEQKATTGAHGAAEGESSNPETTGAATDPGISDDPNRRPGELSAEQVEELERQFWKRLSPTMPPAVYGADEAGTLFGDDPASGWSLAQLDSCLHVLSSIPGVTSPYLYAGMWASVFCAHAEDMNLLSINYLHAGQPKLWYAIAQPDAARFLSLAEHHYNHQLKKCKEFLRHKRCLLSPAILKKAGIRYQTAIQYPGDAIITFPGGFHFGFNAGFNIAEATNFGVPEWVPFGRQAKVCLCRPDSVRIDMDRFTALLQRYEKDRKRNKRLTWKAWRQREERKDGTPHQSGIIEETEDTIIEVVSYARKKRKRKKKCRQSEQQRKNEFWVEVKKPGAAVDGKKAATGKNKSRGASRKGSKSQRTVDTWHLAKPIGRKRLELQTRVLCLVPIAKEPQQLINDTDKEDDEEDSMKEYISSEEEKIEEEEECFAGTIVEIAEGHVRIHFDGAPKADDVWLLEDSPKLFLDGGRWEEERETEGIPALHYWKEMDSRKRLCPS